MPEPSDEQVLSDPDPEFSLPLTGSKTETPETKEKNTILAEKIEHDHRLNQVNNLTRQIKNENEVKTAFQWRKLLLIIFMIFVVIFLVLLLNRLIENQNQHSNLLAVSFGQASEDFSEFMSFSFELFSLLLIGLCLILEIMAKIFGAFCQVFKGVIIYLIIFCLIVTFLPNLIPILGVLLLLKIFGFV